MQRIYDPTAASTLPAPPSLTGTVGYFSGGVPGISAATRVRYWFLNMLQEELMALLALAGITPDTTATVFTQVGAAAPAAPRGRRGSHRRQGARAASAPTAPRRAAC